MNFLIHNMCRLPGADGTWMIVRGGMGKVAEIIAEAAKKVFGVAREVQLDQGRG
jgi:hypothetical protein